MGKMSDAAQGAVNRYWTSMGIDPSLPWGTKEKMLNDPGRGDYANHMRMWEENLKKPVNSRWDWPAEWGPAPGEGKDDPLDVSDPFEFNKAIAAMANGENDGIDTSSDADPLWKQLGFESKQAWREAGKPQTKADKSDQIPTMFKAPHEVWNPNPGHAPNHMFSHGQFTGLAPVTGTAPHVPGMMGSPALPGTLGTTTPTMGVQPQPSTGMGTMSMPSMPAAPSLPTMPGQGMDYSQSLGGKMKIPKQPQTPGLDYSGMPRLNLGYTKGYGGMG